jgi:hypothetical protein
LEYLTSKTVRRAAGVKTWNTYVFANAGKMCVFNIKLIGIDYIKEVIG